MNEYLGKIAYGQPGFVDPGLWDTKLTDGGVQQAQALNAEMRKQVMHYIRDSRLQVE